MGIREGEQALSYGIMYKVCFLCPLATYRTLSLGGGDRSELTDLLSWRLVHDQWYQLRNAAHLGSGDVLQKLCMKFLMLTV